ncbi:hypothetical protein [Pyrococcus abyssi]|uniref:Uncharacterized protein n=1 Tax=Pyrococcus abyssi (strain GE5 / Orsay) TaxID=272844 RepID=Q9V0I0_PYRAB|nr:hypothetical protein [Pyrococcus abyssi]CAB49723.1 Hypothetical protein PAB1825 [Pyrococcus abyssi GE5]CCE70210.1 TPA: hypothetical protein PAB1825 [Pyrococcus abyssi GE5]
MRKGQLLSLDALISLIVVTFILASLVTLSDTVRGEIISIVGLYERSNIAENMLDIIVDSPGEPEDWESNVDSVKVPGIGDGFGVVDYNKLKALVENANNSHLLKALEKLSLGRDFLFEVYMSSFNITINGEFPKVYIDNMTFSGPRGGVYFRVSSGPGNNFFTVDYLELIRGETKYVNEEVLNLATGSTLKLEEGDKLRFIVLESVTITVRRLEGGGTVFQKSIPENSVIEVTVTGPETSNFQLTFKARNWNVLKFTGNGNVIVTVSAYSNETPEIKFEKTFYTDLLSLGSPTYYFAVINGSLVLNRSIIKNSMNNSEWIEPVQRIITVERFEYNLSKEPSTSDPLIYGILNLPLPADGFLLISVPSTPGNLTLVAVSGSTVKGIYVYRNSSGYLNAIIVENESISTYTGNSSTISIPITKVFDDNVNEIIGMWLYYTSWDREDVSIEIVPTIEWAIKPARDLGLIKLTVWDEP